MTVRFAGTSGGVFEIHGWAKHGMANKREVAVGVRVTDLTRETIFDFHELLSGNVFRCSFIGLDPSGSPMVTLSLSDSDIYAIDLDLP